ncbi:MAG: helix-turn-helix domain-containing protein [Deltaproteobacteria bacterium]|nr:helix-turn-helix domain-containing protein [Deltaproteobacteria bacterium]
MQKFMTVKEVAIVFRRSHDTIYCWILEGNTFKSIVKVKDGYLIPEDEIKRVIEEGRIRGQTL